MDGSDLWWHAYVPLQILLPIVSIVVPSWCFLTGS